MFRDRMRGKHLHLLGHTKLSKHENLCKRVCSFFIRWPSYGLSINRSSKENRYLDSFQISAIIFSYTFGILHHQLSVEVSDS